MLKRYRIMIAVLGCIVLGVFASLLYAHSRGESMPTILNPPSRSHLDHGAFFTKAFGSGQEVTRACIECHRESALDFMKTAHWQWLGDPVDVPGHEGKRRIGKRNLINNFCIGIEGNWPSCTRCHAGYGWQDDSFDFTAVENVDCLACHDRSGEYRKSSAGEPEKGVNLLAAAKSVGYPKRETCGLCHFYGGGGLGVKHGDLDNSLDNATSETDIHMGRENFLCIDCHRTINHNITGKAYSVSVNHDNGIGCTDCHKGSPHDDDRINDHLDSIACQTCHIPTYANKAPTKMDWDWSKAGDDTRPDNVHEYLKIKGEFVYKQSVTPEYAWFNLTMDRYLVGDAIDPEQSTAINRPRGDINDPTAKIWPFKVHRGKQPYDSVNKILIPPVTAGKGGFWWEFKWDKAIKMGADLAGLPYSGQYGFAPTAMYWPLSHMVGSKEKALVCTDCHGDKGRLDWSALGYVNDPMLTGGRR